jgi:hypothetical protein
MKCISSYFAPAGEKRAKPTATDENQNEALLSSEYYYHHFVSVFWFTINLKFKFKLLLTQTHQQDMVIAQLHKMH